MLKLIKLSSKFTIGYFKTLGIRCWVFQDPLKLTFNLTGYDQLDKIIKFLFIIVERIGLCILIIMCMSAV